MNKNLVGFIAISCLTTGYLIGSLHSYSVAVSEVPQIEVVSIYDGDTITVNIHGWPEIIGERIGIRIKGIDTPELRDDRENVKEIARQAKMFVVETIRNAKLIELRNLSRDKYFRIDADVYVDGVNLSSLLLDKGYAKPYDGGEKPSWP